MCVCTCKYVSKYVYMLYICICMHIYMYIYVYICIYVGACVCCSVCFVLAGRVLRCEYANMMPQTGFTTQNIKADIRMKGIRRVFFKHRSQIQAKPNILYKSRGL
jgi:hypothetical protein